MEATGGPGRSGHGEGGPWGLDAGLRQVLAAWGEDPALSPQSVDRMGELAVRFTQRLTRAGVRDWAQVGQADAAGFVHAVTGAGTAPRVHTLHARRTAVRAVFRTLHGLGAPVADPTWGLRLPPRTATACRPLTEDEMVLLRAASRLGAAGSRSLRRAVVLALAEATAVTSEISAVRVRDVDDPGTPREVQLPGTSRHDPRTGRLSGWGSVIVARHLAVLAAASDTDPGALLVYAGDAVPGQAVAQASACNAVAVLLQRCGLSGEPDVRPGSVRAWAGRTMFDAGAGIEQVARALGCRSLDTAAATIGWRWQHEVSGGQSS